MIDLYSFTKKCEKYSEKKRLSREGVKFAIEVVPDSGPKFGGYSIIITMDEFILEDSIYEKVIHRTNDITTESFINIIIIILNEARDELNKYRWYKGPVDFDHVYLYGQNALYEPYTVSELLDLIDPYINKSI